MLPGSGYFRQNRQCKMCKAKETKQWRRGPDGKGKMIYFKFNI